MNRTNVISKWIVIISALALSAFGGIMINRVNAFHDAELSDLTKLDAGEISAYRWNAMAEFYAAHSELQTASVIDLTTLSAADISAYRWNAMAEFYAAHSELQTASVIDLTTLSAADISAYRWNAMAEFYQEHGLLVKSLPTG